MSIVESVDYEYRSINVLTGIPVGTSFNIKVEGLYGVQLQESDTQPTVESPKHISLTPPANSCNGSDKANVLQNSKEVWCRCSVIGKVSNIFVQKYSSS